MRRFEPGESIALREVWHGRVGAARPALVVLDTSRLTMLYVPIGSHWFGPDHPRPWVGLKAPEAEWEFTEFTWTDTHVLSFAWPGAGHALLHAWDAEWRPLLWYLNIQAPLQRSELGFDTFDHDLDVVIEPEGSAWRWKDEDHVADGVRLGVYTNDDVLVFRREGERGIRRILHREPPFDRDWSDWRPDPSWPVPVLPEDWDVV